jgi:hypothetical protein
MRKIAMSVATSIPPITVVPRQRFVDAPRDALRMTRGQFGLLFLSF